MGEDNGHNEQVKCGADDDQDRKNTEFLNWGEPFLSRKTQKEYPIVPLP